jgi:PAS domain S-box-containing protein
MIGNAYLARYRALLQRFMLAPTSFELEEALLEAGELGKAMVAESATMDDLLALHQQAQRAQAAEWRTRSAAGPPESPFERLAAGDATPLMLAMLLPSQLAEQASAEHRWREEHDKLAAMFEQTDDLVLIFDAQGRLDYLNPAFERATGWRLAAAQAEPQQAWNAVLPATHTHHWTGHQARADASTFLATWSASPIRDREQRLLSHVCIGRDITQLQRLEEGVRQNDKLRAVMTASVCLGATSGGHPPGDRQSGRPRGPASQFCERAHVQASRHGLEGACSGVPAAARSLASPRGRPAGGQPFRRDREGRPSPTRASLVQSRQERRIRHAHDGGHRHHHLRNHRS